MNGKAANGKQQATVAPDDAAAADSPPPAAPSAAAPAAGDAPLDPAVLERIAAVRAHVRESFGKVVMAMMLLPRYRNQTLADLQHMVLEPLIRDRVAIAYPGTAEGPPLADVAGLAIWASVSEEVDGRIREQIGSGTFPLRLKAEDWNSGEINWLIDVIAPDQKTTAAVIANFKQVVKSGSLRLHPLITRLLDEETLKKMGAERMAAGSVPPASPVSPASSEEAAAASAGSETVN